LVGCRYAGEGRRTPDPGGYAERIGKILPGVLLFEYRLSGVDFYHGRVISKPGPTVSVDRDGEEPDYFPRTDVDRPLTIHRLLL